MPVDYSRLNPGQVVSEKTYVLDARTVSRYVEAVADRSAPLEGGLAPPMAVAALSLRGVVQDLAIPGGTLHAGQEVAFDGGVRIGERLTCIATLAQNSVRGTWRFLVVELSVLDGGGHGVMSGKSTIMVPAG
jgi:acyl dehydratase